MARSGRVGRAGPGTAITGLALAGVAACVAATTYYLAAYPSYQRVQQPATLVSLPPVTAVVLAGCLWLALRPPRWLLPGRHARRFGIGMATALGAGFVLVSRLHQRGMTFDAGIMSYLLYGPILVVLTGSAVAAAVGRSFRSGLWACAWATVLAAPLIIVAWLAEALRWYQQGRGLLLDGTGGLGVGANLGDAIWWPLVFLVLWALLWACSARPPGAHERGAGGPASTPTSPLRPEKPPQESVGYGTRRHATAMRHRGSPRIRWCSLTCRR